MLGFFKRYTPQGQHGFRGALNSFGQTFCVSVYHLLGEISAHSLKTHPEEIHSLHKLQEHLLLSMFIANVCVQKYLLNTYCGSSSIVGLEVTSDTELMQNLPT